MKAKEYYAKLKSFTSEDEFFEAQSQMMYDLVSDVENLIKTRKATAKHAIIACILEIDKKYKAFCRIHESQRDSLPDDCFIKNVEFLDDGFKAIYVELHKEHFEISDNMDSISIVLNDESKSSFHNDKKINVSLGRFLSSIKTVNGKGTYLDVSDKSFPEKYRSVYIRASHLYNLIAYHSDQDTLDRTIENISYISALDGKTSISVIKVILKE